MSCRPGAFWFAALAVLLGRSNNLVAAEPLRLPETFPIAMAFRPLESGDAIEGLAPFAVVHAGPIEAIKGRWPEKICIVHRPYAAIHRRLVYWKGRSIAQVWPGHFLYWTGSKVTRDVAADPAAATIYVEHPDRFRADTPNGLGVPDDVVLYRLGADGQPDWSHVEYAVVTKVGGDSIQVQRAQYGTQPVALEAGKAVAAVHAQYCGDNTGVQSWSLNFSLDCPKSPDGLTAAEWAARYWADELSGRYSAADGIEFDVGMWRHTLFGRPIDCNNDLQPDWGYLGGVNSSGLGGQVFTRELRRLFGPDKIIQVDSSGAGGGYRGWKYVNGIEMESFPSGSHFDRFSPAFEHLRHWSQAAEGKPKFSYGFTKIATTVFGDKHLPDGGKTDFRFRVGLASALMVGMPHPYAALGRGDERRGAETAGTFGIFPWDEYRGGDLNDWHWLGKPLGPARQVFDGLASENLLAHVRWQLNQSPGYAAAPVEPGNPDDLVGGVRVTKTPEGRSPDAFGVSLQTATAIALEKGREYTLQFRARGDDRWEYRGQTFEQLPRLISIQWPKRGEWSVLADSNWRDYSMSFVAENAHPRVRLSLGVGEQVGATFVQNVRLFAGGGERWQRDFEHGKVLLNMTTAPWKVTVGSGYRYLCGQQAPEVNTGKPAPEVLTVPPGDARFLVKEGL